LENSLDWIDLAIKLLKKNNPKDYPRGCIDTKANVLYKIGRTSEAIKIESEIIRHLKLLNNENGGEDKAIKEYSETLENMKGGKPTYLNQGAKWDNYMLPKKQDSQISSSK
jgi:hypothetical protein